MKRSNSPSQHSTSSEVSKSSVTVVSSSHMTTSSSFGSRSTLSVNSKLFAPRKTLLSLPTPSQKKRILHTPSTHRVSEKAHVQPLIREPRITGRKRVSNHSTSHVTRPSDVKHVKGEHASVWSIISNEHVPAVVGKEICSRRRVYFHPQACVGHSHVHSMLSHEPHAVHVMDHTTTCGRCIHHGHHGHIHQSSLSQHFQHNPCMTIRPHTRGCIKRQDSMASVLTWN